MIFLGTPRVESVIGLLFLSLPRQTTWHLSRLRCVTRRDNSAPSKLGDELFRKIIFFYSSPAYLLVSFHIRIEFLSIFSTLRKDFYNVPE